MCSKYIKKNLKLIKDMEGDSKKAERLNNIKMQVIPKLIYKFDAMSIKMPLEFIFFVHCMFIQELVKNNEKK